MAKLENVIMRGTNAARPAATAVAVGTLYYDTTNSSLGRSNGTSWESVEGAGGLSDMGTVTYLDFTTAAAPANPAAGKIRVYSKTGDTLSQRTSGGVETVFGAGGGGGASLTLDANAASAVGSGDLFGGTTLDAGWSSLQTTALTTVERTNAGYLILGNSAAMGSGVYRGLDRAFSPAGDFTIWARVENIVAADFIGVAILAGATDPSDGAGGDRIQSTVYHSGGNMRAQMSRVTGGVVTNIFDAGTTTAMPIHPTWAGHPFPVWIGLRRVGTALSMGFSQNGVKLRWHATTATISFTVNTVGIAILQQGASDSESAVIDYVATSG